MCDLFFGGAAAASGFADLAYHQTTSGFADLAYHQTTRSRHKKALLTSRAFPY